MDIEEILTALGKALGSEAQKQKPKIPMAATVRMKGGKLIKEPVNVKNHNNNKGINTMSNIPVTLSFENHPVRLIVINGVPKFSATDICNILGYVNPNKTLGRFCASLPEYVRMDTTGGPQNVRIVSPDDIRDILYRTRRPHARKLLRWFEDKIFPAFRVMPSMFGVTELAAR